MCHRARKTEIPNSGTCHLPKQQLEYSALPWFTTAISLCACHPWLSLLCPLSTVSLPCPVLSPVPCPLLSPVPSCPLSPVPSCPLSPLVPCPLSPLVPCPLVSLVPCPLPPVLAVLCKLPPVVIPCALVSSVPVPCRLSPYCLSTTVVKLFPSLKTISMREHA